MKRRLIIAIVIGWVASLILAVLFRAPILRGAAHAWSVSTPSAELQPADAILVLGGGLETRPFVAAELYHRGLAPQILLCPTESSPLLELGFGQPHHLDNRDVLLTQGVPEDAIHFIGEEVTSTRDEAGALRDWLHSADPPPAQSILIVSNAMPSRRVRWAFRNTLNETPVTLQIHGTTGSRYTLDNWWTTETGLIDFNNEFLKYLLYRWQGRSALHL